MEIFDVYPLFNITPVRGEGVFLYDENGTQYLDLYGGHAVISIGHSHPAYISAISRQVDNLGFYSNSVKNPLQQELADKLERISGCKDYSLFLCNSGAEANENALKLASFHTGKKRVICFENAFHGRTSGAVAVTDNSRIASPFNSEHQITRLPFGQLGVVEKELLKGDVAAVITEIIQGLGGLDEASSEYYRGLWELCREHRCVLIADEVQSGYGRTGDFFAFSRYGIRPDIISMAKGMGNGFPIGGILIDQAIKPEPGLLGTTFGGNHLACAAGIAVLEVIEKEQLMGNTGTLFRYFEEKCLDIPQIRRLKGRGLMLGLEFDFEVASLRKQLLFEHSIFTGSSSNKNLLRILPPLCIEKIHIDAFFEALKASLNINKNEPQ